MITAFVVSMILALVAAIVVGLRRMDGDSLTESAEVSKHLVPGPGAAPLHKAEPERDPGELSEPDPPVTSANDGEPLSGARGQPSSSTGRGRGRKKSGPTVANKTLSDLLENIEGTMDELGKETEELFSNLRPENRRGLMNIGPFIPYGRPESADPEGVKLIAQTQWPGLMLLWLGNYRMEGETVYPTFFYAIRHKSTHWRFERLKGIVYECGFVYRFDEKNQWHSYVASVNPETCDVRIGHTLVDEHVAVPGGTYMRRRWKAAPYEFAELGNKESATVMRDQFIRMMNLWNERGDQWSISVRRNKRRATFLVPPNQTKDYFRNREFDASPSGKSRRKIIHYVAEHRRRVGDRDVVVKEHLRGNRVFEWHGYSCFVTAPRFHSFSAHAVERSVAQIAPIEVLDDSTIPDGFVGIEEIAEAIAQAEDSQSWVPMRELSAKAGHQ